MPKCRSCEYLVKEKGEYGDEYCIIFGYDTPEKYIAWEGEGCRCTNKMLKKFYEENLKAEEYYIEQKNQELKDYIKALDKACERLDWDCPVSQELVDDLDCENCNDNYKECWKKYFLKEVLE